MKNHTSYEPHFDGPAYVPQRDFVRLTRQVKRVFDLMKDARWRTLEDIALATGDPSPSVSAQLRHLRKPRFGAHTVNRRHVGGGLYEYQLLQNTPPQPRSRFRYRPRHA